MATYKEKVGTAVVNYAGNYPGAVDGELWYDSTNKDFKYQYPNVTSAGSWRSGANLNTAREGLKGAGTQTSALAIAGYSTTYLGNTESYNGTVFTEVNDLNTARYYQASDGADNTAALAFGGITSSGKTGATESWNGTNWTEVNDLGTARDYLTGFGKSYTASVAAGGGNAPGITGKTETWNGTNWTEVNDMNVGS
jgi:hypothetical protein